MLGTGNDQDVLGSVDKVQDLFIFVPRRAIVFVLGRTTHCGAMLRRRYTPVQAVAHALQLGASLMPRLYSPTHLYSSAVLPPNPWRPPSAMLAEKTSNNND